MGEATMDRMFLIIALFAVCGGTIVYVLLFPYLSDEARAQKRQKALSRASVDVRFKEIDTSQRRKSVAETVRGLEAKDLNKGPTLSGRLEQAGLSWSVMQFSIGIAILTILATGASYWYFDIVLLSLGVGIVVFFGLPRWFLSFLRKRRIKKFVAAFPEAIDIIIRGVKAGLPVGECFKTIAQQSPEPVRSEFRRIIDAQHLGLTMGEAVEILSERVPTPETSFFTIVLSVQEKAGGNLSEALGNLARVLRDRKKMRDKVQAVSMEAKASAAIIGALPFVDGLAVYFFSPDYLTVLFTTTIGNIIIGGTLIWMSIGIFIMHSMINFDV